MKFDAGLEDGNGFMIYVWIEDFDVMYRKFSGIYGWIMMRFWSKSWWKGFIEIIFVMWVVFRITDFSLCKGWTQSCGVCKLLV